jgi:hypothetical protein
MEELANERQAVVEAIESLNLEPVGRPIGDVRDGR